MMINFIRRTAANLFSGYFALVMATGALSISAHLLGMEGISKGLLYFNIVAYILLWFFTLFRLINYFPRLKADLTSHQKGPGFFTLIAGTCMFGSQLVVVANNHSAATFLWGLGLVLWLIVMYTFFTAVTIGKNKPTMAEGINGAWLIAAVATQSISVLGTLLSSFIVDGRDIILFVTLCMYLLGCMLYLNIITLIFYRFTFLEFKYAALTPPYWINMGAVAITTLAGSTLMLHAQNWPFLVNLLPFLKGFTLFFWITGTWWIPLLFILMIWKHYYHRAPLKYDPNFWGMAFPLAMYTTCTFQLSKALSLPFLMIIPKVMVFIAMAAWIIILLGLVHHLYLDMKSNSKLLGNTKS
jgi:tellurite resistance protein TehA-like permease